MGIEANLRASFRDVKLEIISIKSQILQFAEEQKELRDIISKLNEQISKNKKVNTKSSGKKKVKAPTGVPLAKGKIIKTKRVSKHYVGTKDGKKFHIPECPYAKNIKPKSKIIFKSKVKALNEGYKPCECVKKI